MLLSVDIGGTAVKLALADEVYRLTEQHEVSVSFDGYRTPLMTTVLSAVRAVFEGTKKTIEGIGVSATGQVDVKSGTVIGTNGSIPGYEGAEIRRMMEEAFHVPTAVVNDANAALLGEMAAGAAQGYQNVLMITLGTGVGGAIALNGQLVNGALGLAGELGHATLYADGEMCTCGNKGCYERYASTAALVRRAQAAMGDRVSDGRTLFTLAQQGDAQANAVIAAWREDIAAGLIGMIHLLNPELVLLGGGVCRQEELLVSPLRERVLKGVMPCFARGLKIEKAALGNDAGLAGAAHWWHACYDL